MGVVYYSQSVMAGKTLNALLIMLPTTGAAERLLKILTPLKAQKAVHDTTVASKHELKVFLNQQFDDTYANGFSAICTVWE